MAHCKQQWNQIKQFSKMSPYVIQSRSTVLLPSMPSLLVHSHWCQLPRKKASKNRAYLSDYITEILRFTMHHFSQGQELIHMSTRYHQNTRRQVIQACALACVVLKVRNHTFVSSKPTTVHSFINDLINVLIYYQLIN